MGLFTPAGVVGLELDTGVIRAVELKGKSRSASLTAAGTIDIPEDAVVEGVVADPGAVAKALNELWNKARLSRGHIVLGISNQGVLMRMATFPKLPAKKMAQIIRFQAGDYIPIPLTQSVFDFSVVGESTGQSGPVLDVLLVAARRDLLDKSLTALDQAGLKPVVVDASALALMRTIPKDEFSRTVILADISNSLSLLMMVSGGVPLITRVIPHSLQTYAKEVELPLSEILSVSRQVAAAVEEGAGPSGGVEPVHRWWQVLAGEIRTTIGYHLAQRSEGSVDLVVLSGRGAKIPGLPGFLQQELGIPVEVNKPLTAITGSIHAGVDIDQEEPEFAVSIGLAMRGLEV